MHGKQWSSVRVHRLDKMRIGGVESGHWWFVLIQWTSRVHCCKESVLDAQETLSEPFKNGNSTPVLFCTQLAAKAIT